MTTTSIKPNSDFEKIGLGARVGRALPILLVVYLIVWILTRAHFMADTNVYTQAILRHQSGTGPVDYHLTTANPFWDFGHILWRPLGWLCFSLAKSGTDLLTHQNQRTGIILTLMGMNFVASFVCVLFFFLLVRKITAAEGPAALATIGFLSGDAFLNYAHTGNAYVVGLSCLAVGMYFTMSGSLAKPSTVRAVSAGLMFALAVLFWFPYVFVLPAAIAAPILLNRHDQPRLRLTVYTLGACAVVGLAVYASVVAALGIHTIADLKEWILASGHGHIQPGGIRAAARLAFSVPRSFMNMDRDGMWLKRYLVHDPFAPVTGQTLFRLSLWKLVVFYASALTLCIELLRSKRGKILLLLLVGAILPIFVFAVFIFEAGSIERYLPLYPFVFLGVGYVFSDGTARVRSKALLVLALAAMMVVNVNAMRSGTLELRRAEAIGRIHDLVPLLIPHSTVMAVSEQDSLAEFRQNFPLDAINVNAEWGTYDVLEINTERLATWREDFAKRALRTWERGGAVWIPKRFLQAQPRPEWNWVEGDDKRVKWTDLPAFFSQFDVGPNVDGDDGFLQLQDSHKNRELLESLDQRAAS